MYSWRNDNPYPVNKPPLRLEYAYFCSGLSHFRSSKDFDPRPVLGYLDKWLHAVMVGLQKHYRLSSSDPVVDATNKCKGNSDDDSNPICVWLEAHNYLTHQFKPAWNAMLTKRSLAQLYLKLASLHPSLAKICHNIPFSSETFSDYFERIAMQRFFSISNKDNTTDTYKKYKEILSTIFQPEQLYHAYLVVGGCYFSPTYPYCDDLPHYDGNEEHGNFCVVKAILKDKKNYPSFIPQNFKDIAKTLAKYFKAGYKDAENRAILEKSINFVTETLGDKYINKCKELMFLDCSVFEDLLHLSLNLEEFLAFVDDHPSDTAGIEARKAGIELSFRLITSTSVYNDDVLVSNIQLMCNWFKAE